MKRIVATLCLLALLTASAGCMDVVGPERVDENELTEGVKNVNYEWNTSADVTLNLSTNQYRSVYTLGDRTSLEVYTRDAFGRKKPLDIKAVKFRYSNGSVITVTDSPAFYVVEKQDKSIIHVPESGGKVAFVAPKGSRSISLPVFFNTDSPEAPSYEVILPENMAVAVPLLASVQPGGYETTQVNGRVHLYWEAVETPFISVRYYLERDLLIFGAIATVLTVVGIIGAGYYLFQIRELEQRREDVGLDVETGDE